MSRLAKSLATTLLLLVALPALHARAADLPTFPNAPPPSAADAEILTRIEAIVRDRANASQKGDVARWRAHIARDCLWIGVGLGVETTDSVAAAQIGYIGRVEVENFAGRVHGDMVVATYVLVQHLGEGTSERIVRLRKLDSYHQWGGDWWLVSNAESTALPARTVVAVSSAKLDRYVGHYAGAFAQKPVSVRVWRSGKALMMQDTTSAEPAELRPTGQTTFFVEGEPAEWVFEFDAKNRRANALLYRAGGVDLRFERADD